MPHALILLFSRVLVILTLNPNKCEFSNGVVPGNVEPVSCVALQRLKTVLCSVFGHTQFRPGQLEAMLPALHGKDGIVKMATGTGKSLCMFMVPLAYFDTAVGVIISPLNALMDDQVTLKYYVPKLCNETFTFYNLLGHKAFPTGHKCYKS